MLLMIHMLITTKTMECDKCNTEVPYKDHTCDFCDITLCDNCQDKHNINIRRWCKCNTQYCYTYTLYTDYACEKFNPPCCNEY